MAELVWDSDGTRKYTYGVDHVVLYLYDSSISKWVGYAWNGIISITKSPDGAEETELWADNIKYGGIRSAEKLSGSIEAYAWPPQFDGCDGVIELAPGIKISQQTRKPFCLAYRTKIGNDQSPNAGYRYHIIYNAICKPSEKSHETQNDNPDAATYSWDFDTTPVAVTGKKQAAHIEFDSTGFVDNPDEPVYVDSDWSERFVTGKYTDLSGSYIGDKNPPYNTAKTDDRYGMQMIPCKPGDKFIVTARIGSSIPDGQPITDGVIPWGFVGPPGDGYGHPQEVYAKGELGIGVDDKILVSENTGYLIVNHLLSADYSVVKRELNASSNGYADLIEKLFGSGYNDAELPFPNEIANMFGDN